MLRGTEKHQQWYIIPFFPDNRTDEECKRYEISGSAKHPRRLTLSGCVSFTKYGLTQVNEKVQFYKDLVNQSEKQCSIADANALAVTTDSERPISSGQYTETSLLLQKPSYEESMMSTMGSELALF